MKKAILIIPETGNNCDLTTNGVNIITIVNTLTNLTKGLCQNLVKQAKEAVGDNPIAQEKYLDKLIKQANREEDGINGKNILNLN